MEEVHSRQIKIETFFTGGVYNNLGWFKPENQFRVSLSKFVDWSWNKNDFYTIFPGNQNQSETMD